MAGDGCLQVNLHSDSRPPPMVEKITGKFGAGFDARLPQGKVVSDTCLAYFRSEICCETCVGCEVVVVVICERWVVSDVICLIDGAGKCLRVRRIPQQQRRK